MARLKDMPNEILVNIFTYVSDINHSSIFNVTLVNKHFNQIASPLRVRHWSDEGFYGYYYGDSPCPSISRLALELLRHPEYRLQVKSLSFSYFQNSYDRDPARVPLSSDNLQMLAWAAEEVVPTLAESTYICARILEDNDDAIAVLVLAWATNLTSLSITVPFLDPTPGYDQGPLVLRFAKQLALRFDSGDLKPSAPLPLAKLQELEFRHNDTENDVALKYMSPFLYLPNLKDIEAYRLGDTDYNDLNDSVERYIQDKYCMPLPAGTSSIESIILEETTLSDYGLQDLLESCKSLRAFHIDFSAVLDHDVRNSTILAASLVQHATTLNELEISVDNSDVAWIVNQTELPECVEDCYRELTCLKRLSIPMSHLLQDSPTGSPQEVIPEQLPASITHLKLCNSHLYCNWQSPHNKISLFLTCTLSLLMEAGPQRRLRNFQVLDCSEALLDDPEMEMIQEMKQLAEECGVTLLLRPYVTHNGGLIT
ncbi:uncharacterized protein BKA55DRAFT_697163 [Fusarium redolens]|uniref:F-box domain-containing protein n=1 Tax=Fusarium redolens TaxID=48865 RepID=A0A9P9JLJ3_FUSRE|nr:uncharacterized protein BKA55DRAFT_697163 [Fusarium redolens]KAH7224324.1 hypothetical protein BKA55DRAFT_697163 [Fusarium redolens]